MKQNHTLSLLIAIILCITQSNVLHAKPTTAGKALYYTKKIVGGSMLIVGVPLLINGVAELANYHSSEASVRAFHQLGTVVCLCIGIPSTALGLLIVLPDESSQE